MALYVNGKQISGGGGGGNTNSVELTYAEYQALTPEQQLDGTEYFITDINGDGQDFQPICYSEEEREIGVWIDGKPLYQKTVTLEQTLASQEYYTLISDSTFTLIGYNSDGTRFIRNNGQVWSSSFGYDGGTVFIYQETNGDIKFSYKASGVVIIKAEVTLLYTKTTDQAGSGTWTPQGVPAHHYSNNEHIVGTWVDGSTLYEKTIDYTVNKSASHTFDFTDGNVKRVVGGFIINSLNSICFPVNCSWEGKTEEFLYDETHFYIKTSANLGDSNTLRIIVQYTKSST